MLPKLREEHVLIGLQVVYCLIIMVLFSYFMLTRGTSPDEINVQMTVVAIFLFGKEALASFRGIKNGESALVKTLKRKDDT